MPSGSVRRCRRDWAIDAVRADDAPRRRGRRPRRRSSRRTASRSSSQRAMLASRRRTSRIDARRPYTPAMRFFRSKPKPVPSPAEALPGRPDPIVEPGIHTVLGTPIAGPWPEGTETADLRPRLLLGRREGVLAAPRRGHHGRRLRRRLRRRTRPTRRPAPAGPATPRSSRSRTTRADLVRAAAQDLLGGPRPDPGHAPGQRHGHAVPLDHPRRPTPSSAPPAEASRDMYQERLTAAGYGAITTEITRAGRVLLRRGLPPAVPRQESPNGYCPNHATGVKLPEDFKVTPLQYVD